ncbi:hypothetical protein [Isachenkonia alkalipeptolytica]|uniref:Thioredoxin domain-containing protein n=1 Tax=Isachenkonia alkalipeptolytica TaxID=2565777 RepID=A0AA44BEK9_9CLOT|nr:hypothetical protein [Isachenkonia alkalipeptolytica]NBG89083.1 hypothetical protein [Isachenkonia alkalipeptolytica]
MRMKNKDILKIAAIIFLAFALIAVFRWVIFDENNTDPGDGRRAPEERESATEVFGDLSIETLEGEPSSIEENEGMPIVLTFWEPEDEESQEQLLILDNLLLLLEDDVAFLSVFEPEDYDVPYTAVIDSRGGIFQQYSELVTEERLLADVEELLEREEN